MTVVGKEKYSHSQQSELNLDSIMGGYMAKNRQTLLKNHNL